MEVILSVVISIVTDVASHFVCKWFDRFASDSKPNEKE